MATFIQLTDNASNKPLWVNADALIGFIVDASGGTQLLAVGSTAFISRVVKEPPEEVVRRVSVTS